MNVHETTIFQAAKAKGLPDLLSAFIVAQAKHETGNFTSNAFTRYNNAFGYSYTGSKYQTGKGLIADNGQPVAAYASVKDSTFEIADWIGRRVGEGKFPIDLNTIRTPDQYAQLLKAAGYYGDTVANYSNGLRYWFESLDLKNIAVVGGGGLLIVVGIAVAWYLLSIKKTG